MNRLARATVVGIFAVVAALVVGPTAATAADAGYEPSGPAGGAVIIAPGGTGTICFTGFQPNEDVEFTLTGEDAADATLASLAAAVNDTSTVKQADGDGDVCVTVTLPETAEGEYTLNAEGLESGESATALIQAGAGAGDGDSASDSAGALPDTGMGSGTITALIVGGVLLLSGLVVAGTATRRQRQRV